MEFPERERHALEKASRRYLQLLLIEAVKSRIRQRREAETNGRENPENEN